MLLEHECFLIKLELEQAALSASNPEQSGFEVDSYVRIVPPFVEKGVKKYFPVYECVAHILKGPSKVWLLLLQSVFIGKAQETCSA